MVIEIEGLRKLRIEELFLWIADYTDKEVQLYDEDGNIIGWRNG